MNEYPELSLAPANLVPACADCNFKKRNHVAALATDQFIHPYYESPNSLVWLEASAHYTDVGELTILYNVLDNPQNDVFLSRITFQFKKLDLNALYSAQAATQVNGMEFLLRNLHNVGGSDAVRERMIEDHISFRHVDINSWQTAMYALLLRDERFLSLDWIL